MEKKNIALLCDYGLDDVIATLFIFDHADKFNNIDIVPVAGNFPLNEVIINAKRIVTHCETTPKNIRLIDTSAVKQNEDKLQGIHGNDGMGDVLPENYEDNYQWLPYGKWLDELDDSYIIVSLGPATVTADILRKKGALPLVIMGGNISEPPNYNGYEFNHGMNIPAFEEMVKYPHLVATLDSCHTEKGNLNLYDYPKEGWLGRFAKRYQELSLERNESACYVYDLTAAVYLVYPERFTTVSASDKDGNKLTLLKYISEQHIL